MNTKTTRLLFIMLCSSMILATGSVSASPAVGSDGLLIAAPASVSPGALEANDTLHLFSEGIFSVSNLAVDVSAPGALPFHLGNMSPGLISGTVESFFIHHDPVGPFPINISSAISEFTFHNEILGVIFRSSTLNASETVNGLGAAGTLYPTGAFGRGAESIFTGDAYTWIPGMPNVLEINSLAIIGIDQIRVITRTPEPSTYLGLGTLLMFAAVAVQRRKVKA